MLINQAYIKVIQELQNYHLRQRHKPQKQKFNKRKNNVTFFSYFCRKFQAIQNYARD